jgi:hypothetical protein
MAAFIAACRRLDTLVTEQQVTQDEAQIAILLMTVSDKRFFKAIQAFHGLGGTSLSR